MNAGATWSNAPIRAIVFDVDGTLDPSGAGAPREVARLASELLIKNPVCGWRTTPGAEGVSGSAGAPTALADRRRRCHARTRGPVSGRVSTDESGRSLAERMSRSR